MVRLTQKIGLYTNLRSVVKLQMQTCKWVSEQDFEGLIKIPIVLEVCRVSYAVDPEQEMSQIWNGHGLSDLLL